MTQHAILNPPIPNTVRDRFVWGNLHGASLGLALSALLEKSKVPVLIVAPDTLTSSRLEYELRFFHQSQNIIHFPDWETLPYDQFSPHQDIISERLASLHQIPHLQQGAIITSISTLMHRLAPREFLEGHTFLLKEKDTFDIESACLRLTKVGYQRVDQVREHGEFAVRGSIVDLFPMGVDAPFRIDLFDDEIDSIRTFSPENQRTLDKVEQIQLLPANEFPLNAQSIELFRQAWRQAFSGNPLNCATYSDVTEGICTPGIEYYLPFFFKETATLFDYLPNNCLIIQLGETFKKAEEFWHEAQTRYQQRRY
jgi:transcription-repair coupling factor (superfamily II helicase)